MADTPDYVNGEPEPVHNFNPSVHDLLINDAKHSTLAWGVTRVDDTIRNQMIDIFRARKEYGLKKYGTVLQADNGRDFLRDAVDEMVDFLAYVRTGLEENPGDRNLLDSYCAAIRALKHLMIFGNRLRLEKISAEDEAMRITVDTSLLYGRTQSAATVRYDANGPSRKVPCDCESGAKCGGTGFKDA